MPDNTSPAVFAQADVADYVVVTATIAPPYWDGGALFYIPRGIPQAFQPCSLPAIFPGTSQSIFFPTPSYASEAAGRLWDEVTGILPPEDDYE